VTKIAPVYSAVNLYNVREVHSQKNRRKAWKYHVNIEDSNTGRKFILEKDSCKFVVNKSRAFFEAPATLGIKHSALKLFLCEP
jgi:hypothetical protein